MKICRNRVIVASSVLMRFLFLTVMASHFTKNQKTILVVLFLVIVVSGFLYFYHITEKGLFGYDEALFMLIAQSFSALPKIAWQYALHQNDIRPIVLSNLPGHIFFQTSARPIFILSDIIGIFIFGKNDYSAFAMNGLIGLGSIFIVYLVAKRLSQNGYQALLASLFLGISGYQVFYARSGSSQLLAGAFLLLGAWYYLKTLSPVFARSDLLKAGLFWGLMFLAHYNTILILFLILVFEAVYAINKKRLSDLWRRLLYIFAPLILVIGATEVFSILRTFILGKFSYPVKPGDYISEIFSQFRQVAQENYRRQPLFYANIIRILDGWPYLILILAGPIVFFWQKWYRNWQTAFIFFITYISLALYSSTSLTVTRTIEVLSGFIALTSAMAYSAIFTAFRNYFWRAVLIIFLIIFVAWQFVIDWHIVNLKSGYRQAAVFLKAAHINSEDVYTESWPILAFYLNQKVQILNRNPKTVYYMAEWNSYGSFYRNLPAGELVASFDNPAGDFIPLQKENIETPLEPGKINIYKVGIK